MVRDEAIQSLLEQNPLYTYLLIIAPPEQEVQRIMHIKRQVAIFCAVPQAMARPHITLAQFDSVAKWEPALLQSLQRVAACNRSHRIRLLNFGSFPQHTVFIDVLSTPSLPEFIKKIRAAISWLPSSSKKVSPGKPHLTIARRLQASQFQKMASAFEQASYSGSFLAQEICLLKRRYGAKAYEEVRRFPFLGQPEKSLQIELFP